MCDTEMNMCFLCGNLSLSSHVQWHREILGTSLNASRPYKTYNKSYKHFSLGVFGIFLTSLRMSQFNVSYVNSMLYISSLVIFHISHGPGTPHLTKSAVVEKNENPRGGNLPLAWRMVRATVRHLCLAAKSADGGNSRITRGKCTRELTTLSYCDSGCFYWNDRRLSGLFSWCILFI